MRKQQMVAEFHRHVGATTGPNRPSAVAYRSKFVSEEANELETAMQYDDLVGTIDALCDLLYVVYGTAVSLGVDLDPYFAEVHRSNMTKTPNENGKAIKGPDYSPPDIVGLVRRVQ